MARVAVWSFIEGLTLDGLFIIGLSLQAQQLMAGDAVMVAGLLLALSSERVWNDYKHIHPCLYGFGAGLLLTGLLGKYILWATQSLLDVLPGIIHG